MDACQYSGLEKRMWRCIEAVSSKAARQRPPFYNDNVNITKEYFTWPKFQQHKNGSRMDLSELHICTHTYACRNRVRPQWSNGILLVKLTPRFHCGIPTLEMPGTRKSLRHKYYFFIVHTSVAHTQSIELSGELAYRPSPRPLDFYTKWIHPTNTNSTMKCLAFLSAIPCPRSLSKPHLEDVQCPEPSWYASRPRRFISLSPTW